jgi:O-antigen/teichoic acid export membrane protein
LANWGAFAITAAIAFFLAPFVVNNLGDGAYGAWVLLGSLVGYMGLLDLGVRGAVTRFLARFHAQGDHNQASGFASSALVLFLAAGLVAIIASLILAGFVVDRFTIPPGLVSDAKTVLVLGGFTMAFSLVNGVFGGVIAGLQRYDYISAVEIASEVLRATLVVVALGRGHGIVALATIQLAIAVLRTVTEFVIGRRLYPELTIRRTAFSKKYIVSIFSFSFYTVAMQASGRIIMYSDAIVISAMLPIGVLTFFAIGNRLTQQVRSIISGITKVVTPMASAMGAKDENDELRQAVLDSGRFATLVSLPILLTLLLRGESFIGLWMGPRFAAPSGAVLGVLALAGLVQGGYGTVTAATIGVNRHRVLVIFFLLEAAANLALSIWLAPRYGIVGVAWGTAGPRLVVGTLVGPWFARRTFGVGVGSYVLNAWIRPAASMVPFALATYAIEVGWRASSLWLFFGQVIAVLPVAAVCAWYISLNADERRTYWGALTAKLRPTAK